MFLGKISLRKVICSILSAYFGVQFREFGTMLCV